METVFLQMDHSFAPFNCFEALLYYPANEYVSEFFTVVGLPTDDSSRVVLVEGHDDYINASHIGVTSVPTSKF